ncbi:conserved protein of unknown function (plasmid) [Cupriavidus taiwanensis]|uniref:Tyrosine specific protein phosphatases domain-containing protein n=1 Tax=Cupriavidus taiwanensis TaxID=164546 RepID=A0A375IMQ2_9BURK|nr:hypothetical protein [Cupriavidus taiwanensis]SPK75936.1 conserved protein of unknown function [Cupriavidus taiwanensis]
MTTRLQEVIDKLYKPSPGNARQVFALSRGDAEKLPRLPSIAVISITAPERAPANLDGFDRVLRLSFADVDFLKSGLSTRAKARLGHAFTTRQSEAVRSFVEALPESIASIVIHCEGGFSRSCAIALALHELYGCRVEMERLTKANSSVFQLMMEHSTDDRHQWKIARRQQAVR